MSYDLRDTLSTWQRVTEKKRGVHTQQPSRRFHVRMMTLENVNTPQGDSRLRNGLKSNNNSCTTMAKFTSKDDEKGKQVNFLHI